MAHRAPHHKPCSIDAICAKHDGQANDKQIGLAIEQKADDGVHGVVFQQMSFQLHALAQSGVTGLGV
jgi:hypothetical protein